jgi:hypothetical protein
MSFENSRSTTRSDRTPETASLRIDRARRLPGVPTTRATSPRRGATCVRGSTGRLASPAQSGRSCIRGFRGEGAC